MKCCITTFLFAAISIQLRFTFAFLSNFYSEGNGTLDTLSPVNVTSKLTPQTAVKSSANLTSTNLTFTPWPSLPFSISWPSQNYSLGVNIVSPWTSQLEPIDLDDLMQFIDIFANNLEQKYPPPDLTPRRVGSTYLDGKTLTRWTIDFQRTPLGRAVPTENLLLCLQELNILLRRHGPASIVAVIYRGTWQLFYTASLRLAIDSLAGNSLNISSLSENNEMGTS